MSSEPDPQMTVQSAALASTTCAGCHQPLNRVGFRGECLRCLLGVALSSDGGSPTALDYAAQRAANQLFHYGHFEVAVGQDGFPVELGVGGMATTYRAYDTVLHSEVALKVINEEVLGHPNARARFLREARAAAKLHHPNVAGVTFYGEQDGECYYAMELVQGETLEARVRREGPLSPALTLEIGVQIAQALAAAEASGVVHRDLKPSNVMLTTPLGETGGAATFVKVIDWGLAKAVNAGGGLGADQTRHGFVGTPAFASPEQFTEVAERRVDLRSDVYSLGVTLWYLLCGRTPFVGRTLDTIRAQQSEPPFAQLAAKKVPRCLVESLRSMLAYDPARRPQSAHELLAALRECQRCVSRRGRYHRSLAAAALLLTVAAGAGVYLYRHHLTPPGSLDRSVAVLPFENLSPVKSDAFFTVGMHDEITDDLARVAQIKVLSASSTRVYPPGQPRDLAAIGRALGVQHLLEGTVRRSNGRVRLTVHLVDTLYPAGGWSKEYEGSLEETFGLQSEVSLAVAERLQTVPSPREKVYIEQPLTKDPQAHDLYLRALTLQGGIAHSDDIQVGLEQASLLEAAVTRDPTFTAAYLQLAGIHSWLYEGRGLLPDQGRNVDHRRLSDEALAKARALDPDNGDLHLATADTLLTRSENYAQAQVELDLARRTLPNSVSLEAITGKLAYCQGHWKEALRAEERAVALNPMDWATRQDVAHYYRHLRYFEKCDRELEQVIATVPAEDTGRYRMARALVSVESRADLAPLREALAAFSPADDPTGRTQFRSGFLLDLLERDAGAAAKTLADYHVELIRGGTHLYPRAYFEAQVAQLRGDQAGAVAAFSATRDAMTKQFADHPDDGWMLSMLAVCDAGMGHQEDAVREALRAVKMEPYEKTQSCATCLRGNLAMVYAWNGQPEQALNVLETLVDKPDSYELPAQASYGDLRLNPCWDVLRDNPRFEALVPRFTQPLPGL